MSVKFFSLFSENAFFSLAGGSKWFFFHRSVGLEWTMSRLELYEAIKSSTPTIDPTPFLHGQKSLQVSDKAVNFSDPDGK